MTLPVPNLDDRDFEQLVTEAKALIAARSPQWSDLSPGDPGMTLVEVFAYLTDTLLYRVNRIPEKAFVRFLDLIGVRVLPPAAASVDLEFSLSAPATSEVVIPRGSRATVAGGEGPQFATTDDARIVPGERSVIVRAYAGEVIDAELLGEGTGGPAQSVRVRKPPIALPTGDVFDLVVGVEAQPGELENREPARESGGRTYRIWSEAPHFGAPRAPDAETHLYTVDRASGTIAFAPAAQMQDEDGVLAATATPLADVPMAGRRIVAWYRHGGGADGNVGPGILTTLKDAIPGVSVTNPTAATGGRDQESLENAMIRGPQSVHSLDRVITARDYEQFAVAASGGVSRARAVTRAEAWVGATPGEVQLFVVPGLGEAGGPAGGRDALEAGMSPHVLDRLATALHARQPIGSQVRVSWTGMKHMFVEASVVVHRAEDREAVERRLRDRLDRVLSPVPTGDAAGWPFGEHLRVARVYDVLQSERGVRYVSNVKLVVEDVPTVTRSLIRDPHQPRTWFCAATDRVFRSVDDSAGWVSVARFEGEETEKLAAFRGGPGHLVALTRPGESESESSVVHASSDYGETWLRIAQFDFHVEGVALAMIDGEPHAFLASDQGLFRQPLRAGAVADRILVVGEDPTLGFYDVSTVVDSSGALRVAVASQKEKGVYLSFDAGRPGTFVHTGLAGEDIRILRTLEVLNRRYLYAAAYATGAAEGSGVFRVEVLGTQLDPQGWQSAGASWKGGSCRDIAFIGETVLAATERAGVIVANPRQDNGTWRSPTRDCGLPLRESGDFQAIATVAAGDAAPPIALAGGPDGVFRSGDGRVWTLASPSEFTDEVSLPPNWLFAPGDHRITVEYGDAG